jgi:hypothetical protein
MYDCLRAAPAAGETRAGERPPSSALLSTLAHQQLSKTPRLGCSASFTLPALARQHLLHLLLAPLSRSDLACHISSRTRAATAASLRATRHRPTRTPSRRPTLPSSARLSAAPAPRVPMVATAVARPSAGAWARWAAGGSPAAGSRARGDGGRRSARAASRASLRCSKVRLWICHRPREPRTGVLTVVPCFVAELGINFSHIVAKSLTVLNPLSKPDERIMDDADLAGPVLFCFCFGMVLLFVRPPLPAFLAPTSGAGLLSSPHSNGLLNRVPFRLVPLTPARSLASRNSPTSMRSLSSAPSSCTRSST